VVAGPGEARFLDESGQRRTFTRLSFSHF
jgi:hypothetical protein